MFLSPNLFSASIQINDGIVLPDKASLYLTAIEDAEYKDDKIECEIIFPLSLNFLLVFTYDVLVNGTLGFCFNPSSEIVTCLTAESAWLVSGPAHPF